MACACVPPPSRFQRFWLTKLLAAQPQCAPIPAVERGFAIAGKPTLPIERSYGELGVVFRLTASAALRQISGRFRIRRLDLV
jgi:hypothetical protein